jgi:hypothetical protein
MNTVKGLEEFLSQKRVAHEEKLNWVKEIINISLQLIEKKGKFVDVKNIKTRPKGVIYKSLDIQYSTPFNKLPGKSDQYILDIWQKNKGKVFSVRWEPLTIVNFKRDKWLYDLFE